MLFSTSSTGPVLEHIATSLTSLFPTRQALSNLLNQGSNFSGSSPLNTGIESNSLSNSLCRVFLPIALVPVLAVTDFSRSCLGVPPYFNSHSAEIASHDSVTPLGNVENSPYQWYSDLH